LAVIAVVVLGIAIKRHAKRSDPYAGLKPGIYQSSNSGETLPLPATHR